MIGDMRNRNGFTLVEMVVAAALFSAIVVIAVNLFVLALRQPLIEVDNQHLQEEIDFVFEALTTQMSQYTIDYGQYGGTITNPETTLYLVITDGGEQDSITLSGGQIVFTNLSSGIASPLTTTANTDVAIDDLLFYIYPTSDPADPAASVNYQPAVVIRISGHSIKQPSRIFQAQTFLTTRTYVR